MATENLSFLPLFASADCSMHTGEQGHELEVHGRLSVIKVLMAETTKWQWVVSRQAQRVRLTVEIMTPALMQFSVFKRDGKLILPDALLVVGNSRQQFLPVCSMVSD